MAKDDKKNQQQGGVLTLDKVNDENIHDQILNANKFSAEIVKAAAEKKEGEEKERAIRELNEIKDKAVYVNLKSVLRTRRDRAHEKATSEMRKTTFELLKKVEGGEMTGRQYDEAIDEAIKKANDACKEANKEYDNLSEELRNKFPGSWRYDWDDPYRKINSMR